MRRKGGGSIRRSRIRGEKVKGNEEWDDGKEHKKEQDEKKEEGDKKEKDENREVEKEKEVKVGDMGGEG